MQRATLGAATCDHGVAQSVEADVRERFGSIVVVVLVVLGLFVAKPYIDRALYSATTPRTIEPRGDLAEAERSTIAIFERVSPSVVQIAGRGEAGVQSLEAEGGVRSGTGFIWDAAGHVVTNAHVVEGTANVAVRLTSGEVVQAETVGTAPNYDTAVIRLNNPRQLPPPLAIGTSADLKVGQFAFAIGNPFGLDQSLTAGIISALRRRLPTSAGREIVGVIQTDAAINPGNSGGPLLDSAGRLIGMNTAIFSPTGINSGVGFAIPVDVVNRVVPELIRNGRVPTPGIGIVAANEAIATRIGVEGVVVVRTAPGSPANRAGLRGVDPTSGTIGDVIVGINGEKVRRLADLTDQLEKLGVGRTAELTVLRNNRTTTVPVEIVDITRNPT
jgi:2-alkenal reductase